MSSHYIIRDDQAPALLIFEAETVSNSILSAFMEWNPTIIINESEIGYILHNNIKVDGIILSKRSKEEVDEILGYQRPYDLFEKDGFPKNLIDYLKEKNIHSIDIVKSFDSEGLKLSKLFESDFNIIIFSDHTKFIHITDNSFQKWASPGRGFIIKKEHPDTIITTTNLGEYETDCYRVESEGIITIKSNGRIWLGEII